MIGGQGCRRMLKAEPSPEEEPVIGATGAMLVPGAPHPSGPHAVDRPERRLGGYAAKPFGERDAKAFLFALDDRLRQQASRDLLQQVLPFAVAQLEMVRQTPAELDKIVVEKHRSGLQRD